MILTNTTRDSIRWSWLLKGFNCLSCTHWGDCWFSVCGGWWNWSGEWEHHLQWGLCDQCSYGKNSFPYSRHLPKNWLKSIQINSLANTQQICWDHGLPENAKMRQTGQIRTGISPLNFFNQSPSRHSDLRLKWMGCLARNANTIDRMWTSDRGSSHWFPSVNRRAQTPETHLAERWRMLR